MKEPNNIRTSIWYDKSRNKVFYIDQTHLPWEVKIKALDSFDDAIAAIKEMEVRGAPLIGVTAAFGMWLASKQGINMDKAVTEMLNTRPTAVNLKWAVDQMIMGKPSLSKALEIRDLEIESSKRIGEYGLDLIQKESQKNQNKTVNILTHCNAGWLACVEWGTATAPIYMAHEKGISLHVWVDETRPRNQGAKLTAWELARAGVPHTVIPDNTGGHLMQNGLVDMVIVGTDRVAANGDVANKIGTYLKALAAMDNNIPFYVAMPYSSFDPNTPTGSDIPIEERDGDEVRRVAGCEVRGAGFGVRVMNCHIIPEGTPVANYGFDITPNRLVSSYITDKGILNKMKM